MTYLDFRNPRRKSKGVQIYENECFYLLNNIGTLRDFRIFGLVYHQMEGSDDKNLQKWPLLRLKTTENATFSSLFTRS